MSRNPFRRLALALTAALALAPAPADARAQGGPGRPPRRRSTPAARRWRAAGATTSSSSGTRGVGVRCGGGVARLHDARTGRLLSKFEAHREEFNEVKFAPRGLLLLTASYDSTVRLWEPGPPPPKRRGRPRSGWSENSFEF